ncbi:MAG: hypothetical protein B7Y37_08820 [Sphingobacteriia bacterium 28-36-52]|nr:MAG: hypothetical protein B7Y37_08820 [Sphingobacteriia bacterium 28-36-52]
MFEFYKVLQSNKRVSILNEAYYELIGIPDPDNLIKGLTFVDYLKSESLSKSKEILTKIELQIENNNSAEGISLMINLKLKELEDTILSLNTDTYFNDEYHFFITDLENIRNILLNKYDFLRKGQTNKSIANSSANNKIQWLGKTNVLATLLYDLWKGQEKGKGKPNTPPMLKADKKDIERLLIENFIDSKGEPLTVSTISDYLNTSKPEKRAKIGTRIEL